MRANVGADLFHNLRLRGLGHFLAGFERHIGINGIALNIVRIAHHSRLGYGRMPANGTFDLGCAEIMTTDNDHVVHAAGDPIITIGITAAAVATEIFTREPREIGVVETLLIAVYRAHLARPRLKHAEIAGHFIAFDDIAFLVYQGRLHPKER